MSDDLEIFGLLTLPERDDDKSAARWSSRFTADRVGSGRTCAFSIGTTGPSIWFHADSRCSRPNPRGSTGRGSEFQRRLIDDVGGGEMRDVIAGAQALVDRGIADPERLGIGGWSWGGYLTAYTITRTQMFKAAVMGAGLANMISDHGTDDIPSANLYYYPGQPYHYLDEYWESSAIKYVTNCVTPTLIVHGESDDRVHVTQGAEMYRALRLWRCQSNSCAIRVSRMVSRSATTRSTCSLASATGSKSGSCQRSPELRLERERPQQCQRLSDRFGRGQALAGINGLLAALSITVDGEHFPRYR